MQEFVLPTSDFQDRSIQSLKDDSTTPGAPRRLAIPLPECDCHSYQEVELQNSEPSGLSKLPDGLVFYPPLPTVWRDSHPYYTEYIEDACDSLVHLSVLDGEIPLGLVNFNVSPVSDSDTITSIGDSPMDVDSEPKDKVEAIQSVGQPKVDQPRRRQSTHDWQSCKSPVAWEQGYPSGVATPQSPMGFLSRKNSVSVY